MTVTAQDIEEAGTTKGEKLLAGILAIFVLTGLIWAYTELKVERRLDYASTEPTKTEQRILDRYDDARFDAQGARDRAQTAQERLVETREAYRTELDAGRAATELQASYQRALARREVANGTLRAARRRVARAKLSANPVQNRLDRAESAADEKHRTQEREDKRETFLLRLALVVVMLTLSYTLIARLRRRGSRYMVLAMATASSTAVLAVVMTIDYLGIEPQETGVLWLSLAGIVLTIIGFVVLQQYLRKRLPGRRVRRRECPNCGFPIRASRFCEGCGLQAVGPCQTCQQDRRIGTVRCGECGAA